MFDLTLMWITTTKPDIFLLKENFSIKIRDFGIKPSIKLTCYFDIKIFLKNKVIET